MNKKTYILGFLALVVLVGVVWFGSQNEDGIVNQTASILGDDQGQEIIAQEVTGDLFIGSPDAPVIIIEYTSHFCSFCIDFHNERLPLLVEKYIKTGQVKLISRFISPAEVGLAVLCAQEEGKFSEMSDHIFKHVQELESADDLIVMAQAVDLNQENFNQCFNNRKYEDRVEEWFDQATQSGVEGTPTFFINGQKIVGNQPYLIFEEAINQAIEESK